MSPYTTTVGKSWGRGEETKIFICIFLFIYIFLTPKTMEKGQRYTNTTDLMTVLVMQLKKEKSKNKQTERDVTPCPSQGLQVCGHKMPKVDII